MTAVAGLTKNAILFIVSLYFITSFGNIQSTNGQQSVWITFPFYYYIILEVFIYKLFYADRFDQRTARCAGSKSC